MSGEPTTEAGRALFDDVRIHNIAQRVKADDKHDAEWLARILAIEAEAAAETARLRRVALLAADAIDATARDFETALAAEKAKVERLREALLDMADGIENEQVRAKLRALAETAETAPPR